MKDEMPNLFSNTMFDFAGFCCCCAKDTENLAPDQAPKITLKMYADIESPLHFAYSSESGLNLTGKVNKIIEKNILGKLLALPNGDIDKHIVFFEKFGFLLPLSNEEYESVDADSLMEVVNRIKATIRLMNSIGKKDYRGVLLNASYHHAGNTGHISS